LSKNQKAGGKMPYNKLTLYSNLIYSYTQIFNKELTSDIYTATYSPVYQPVWDQNTILLTNFNNYKIDCTNVISLTGTLLGYRLYRQKTGATTLDFIKQTDALTTSVIDYLPANQSEYKYLVFPYSETAIGASLESDVFLTNWWNWCLISADENADGTLTADEVYLFDLNLESAEVQQVYDKAIYNGYTRFPKASEGKLNYSTGGINCLIGDVSVAGEYQNDTVDRMESLNLFIANGKRKFLKDRKGLVIEVFLDKKSNKTDDTLIQQIDRVSIGFTQLGTNQNVSVTD
jgi:hypothetical protein